MPLLTLDDVSLAYGHLPLLDRVTLQVDAGERICVIGRNGSGKSTLLRCLAGLLAVERGDIRAREEGRELDTAGRRRRIGFLAPDLALYEELSVAENVELFARLRGVAPEPGLAITRRFALPAGRPWGALSSGMRQRLRWAWALLHAPRLLLLDEPFQNLDAEGEATARALLDEHLAAGGLAVAASPVTLPLPRITGELDLAR